MKGNRTSRASSVRDRARADEFNGRIHGKVRARFCKKKSVFGGREKERETDADTANSQLPPMVRGMR